MLFPICLERSFITMPRISHGCDLMPLVQVWCLLSLWVNEYENLNPEVLKTLSHFETLVNSERAASPWPQILSRHHYFRRKSVSLISVVL